jgi:hypothetical protein
LPEPLWNGFLAVAIAAGALSAALVVARIPQALKAIRGRRYLGVTSENVLLAVFVAVSLLILVARVFTAGPLFDRYLLPVVAVGAMIVIRAAPWPARWRRALAAGALAVLAFVSLAFLVETDRFAVARWHAGERLVRAGFAPSEIDAGFEWVGAHTLRPAAPPSSKHFGFARWYIAYFPGSRNCATVSSVSIDDPALKPIGSLNWQPLPGARDQTLHLYRNTYDCRR